MNDSALFAAALTGSGAWGPVVAFLALAGLALLGGALGGGVLAAARAPRTGGWERREALFVVKDGALKSANRAARRWIKSLRLLPDALEPVETRASLQDGLAMLETEGRAFHIVARDAAGAEWIVEGRPEGGRALVGVRESDAARTVAAEQRRRADSAEAARDAAEAALEASPDLIWRRARDGRLAWANRRYLAAAGGRDADGRPKELDFGGAPRTELSARASRACIFTADTGERLWLDLREVPDERGERLGFGGDASAAIHAEAALRRFVETLTETFAHLRVGLAIFDRETRLGLFNPAFSELMGLDPSWLAARPRFTELLDRLRMSGRLPEPDDFADWRQGMLDMFGETEGRERLERQEIWHLPGDVMMRVVARPHPQGAVALLLEDVSETARLERRWHTANDIRRAVIDRLEEAVAAFGPDGRVRFANPAFARLWGFRPGDGHSTELLTETLERCASLTEASTAWDRVRAFFKDAEARRSWAATLATLDGRRLRLRVAALPDGSVLTAFFDETDAVRAAEALQERETAIDSAEELRSALIEQASRRLRTPLNTISGYGQMLRDEAEIETAAVTEASLQRRRDFADGILDAAAEIQRAMGSVSDLASAQAGAIALRATSLDLEAALDGAIRQAQAAAARQGVRLSRAVSADPLGAEMEGDAARVRQILVNLLIDAVERAEWGAEIRCGARRAGDEVEIWTDAPASADERSSGEPRSLGLALSLARRFSEMHGGRLTVERLDDGGLDLAERRGLDVLWSSGEAALPFVGSADGEPRVRVTCSLPARGARIEADRTAPEDGRSGNAAA
ncbi:MAG: PAS-domain containing protein [Pseudomonadota bacterium]